MKTTGRRVYARGNKLWIRYTDAAGKTQYRSTTYVVGQEAEAAKLLAEVTRQVAAEAPPKPAVETVAMFAERWVKARKHIRTAHQDTSRLNHHVIPYIGSMPIADVRPRHIRDLVIALRDKDKAPGNGHARKAKAEKLAPRTIRHVFATMHRMFKSAIIEELIESNPVVVEKNVLPKNVDKDPGWRATAVFERSELETLISDARIPEARRVIYAIEGIAGLRHGEMAGLRWKAYLPDVRPLGKLVVSRSYDKDGTKTQVSREVPVHAVLAALLDAWKATRWAKVFGREPTADDLVVPSEAFTPLLPGNTREAFLDDLATVGLRDRRGHDLRRTMITLAQVDGARRDILKVITHGASPGEVMNLYTTWPWPTLCGEVAKLSLAAPKRTLDIDGDDTIPDEENVFAWRVPAKGGDNAGDSSAKPAEILELAAGEQVVTKPLLYH